MASLSKLDVSNCKSPPKPSLAAFGGGVGLTP